MEMLWWLSIKLQIVKIDDGVEEVCKKESKLNQIGGTQFQNDT